jgi:hypothetical protein
MSLNMLNTSQEKMIHSKMFRLISQEVILSEEQTSDSLEELEQFWLIAQ